MVNLSIYCDIQPNTTQTALSSVSAFVGLSAVLSGQQLICPVNLTNLSWKRNGFRLLFFQVTFRFIGEKYLDHLSCPISNTHIGLNTLWFFFFFFLQDLSLFCFLFHMLEQLPLRIQAKDCLLPLLQVLCPSTTSGPCPVCIGDFYESAFHLLGSQFGSSLSVSITFIKYSLLSILSRPSVVYNSIAPLAGTLLLFLPYQIYTAY